MLDSQTFRTIKAGPTAPQRRSAAAIRAVMMASLLHQAIGTTHHTPTWCGKRNPLRLICCPNVHHDESSNGSIDSAYYRQVPNPETEHVELVGIGCDLVPSGRGRSCSARRMNATIARRRPWLRGQAGLPGGACSNASKGWNCFADGDFECNNAPFRTSAIVTSAGLRPLGETGRSTAPTVSLTCIFTRRG